MGKIQGGERGGTTKLPKTRATTKAGVKVPARVSKEFAGAALKELVTKYHAVNPHTPLIFAAWYRRDDPRDFYLLEIGQGVSDPGDAEWINIEFLPPPELRKKPKSRLKITYMSPEEFRQGVEDPTTPGHQIYRRILREGFEVLFERGKHKQLPAIKKALSDGKKTRLS